MSATEHYEGDGSISPRDFIDNNAELEKDPRYAAAGAKALVAWDAMFAALKEAQEWLVGMTDSNELLPEDRACLERIDAAIALAEPPPEWSGSPDPAGDPNCAYSDEIVRRRATS